MFFLIIYKNQIPKNSHKCYNKKIERKEQIMNILVSACLIGINCRYDGKNCLQKQLFEQSKKYTLIPICPEQLGGLSTPREPVELMTKQNQIRAKTKSGKDYTNQFFQGAKETLKIAQLNQCQYAILKSKSPSCGYKKIYNGKFDGQLTDGNGITADVLLNHHIEIYTENEQNLLYQKIK